MSDLEAAEELYKLALEKAIDRVRYCRYSIVLANDDYTKGYVDACRRIEQEIEKLKENNGKEKN